MNINGKTNTYGLVGNPVEHSISPTIHNFLAKEMNQDLIYESFCVPKKDLDTAIKAAYENEIQGMNITVPYKTEIIKLLSFVDEEAKKIGAVNTIIYNKDGYHGKNTDCEGLHKAFISDEIPIEDYDVIIIGAGGAARAAIFMCMKYSTNKIYLLNRTKNKAMEVAKEMNSYFDRIQIIPLGMDQIDEIPVVKRGYISIQTTSVGLYPNFNECVIIDSSFYKKITIGYDIIYTPEETQYMKEVIKAGGKAYNGLKMLLFQAILSFETWRMVKVPFEIYEKTLLKMKEELNERK